MSDVTSGIHLSVVRAWIQRNALNGDRVAWGSGQFLQLRPLTVHDMESLAQDIATAVLREKSDHRVELYEDHKVEWDP